MERYNKNRNRLLGSLVGMALAVFTTQAMGAITGSAHDFSGSVAWNSTGEICVVCHTPHNAPEAAVGPLWNHTLSTAGYTVYTSPTQTLDGTAANPPTGASKLCLSCHDGTVGLDSFGGNGISNDTRIGTINAAADFGTNLSDDHPISISYSADTSMVPVATAVTIGGTVTRTGTIGSLLVPGDVVECSSCHDVHNTYTIASTPLLKISNAASALCLTCHAK
jgi:predicted CXXCH cytochrome family protein